MHLRTDQQHDTITALLTHLYRLGARASGSVPHADRPQLIHAKVGGPRIANDRSMAALLHTATMLDRYLEHGAANMRPPTRPWHPFNVYHKPDPADMGPPLRPWHARIDLPTRDNHRADAFFRDDELRLFASLVTVAAALDGHSAPAYGCDWIAVRTRHTLHLISTAVTRSGQDLDHAGLTARARRRVDAIRTEIHRQDTPTIELPNDGTIVLRTRETGVVTAEGCDTAAEHALARIGMRPVALPHDTPWMRTPYGTVPAALPGFAAHANRALTALGYRVDQRLDAPEPSNNASVSTTPTTKPTAPVHRPPTRHHR